MLQLAQSAIVVEKHYSDKAGAPTPMDIEWAKDGSDGKLYIIQARPETVASRRKPEAIENYALKSTGKVVAAGRAVGEKIAAGKVRLIRNARDLRAFRPGEVLVAPATSPDWEPVMKAAAAIITDHGGRTCHAAIVARELGVPAVVGTENFTRKAKTGMLVTVCCAEGDIGHVYQGSLPFAVDRVAIDTLERPRTEIMVNLGNPEIAFKTAMGPSDGVGLARMEFIISQHIGIHPMALAQPEKVKSARDRRAIKLLTAGYKKPSDFFVERLSEGVGTIAAAFYPRPVIVRLSDFKTNEYANLKAAPISSRRKRTRCSGSAARPVMPTPPMPRALRWNARRCAGCGGNGIDQPQDHDSVLPAPRGGAQGHRGDGAARSQAGRGRSRDFHDVRDSEQRDPDRPVRAIVRRVFDRLQRSYPAHARRRPRLRYCRVRLRRARSGNAEDAHLAVEGAKRNHRHVGICGEAPANYPEIARFLTGLGIDSISVNPSSLLRTMMIVHEAEQATGKSQVAALQPSIKDTPLIGGNETAEAPRWIEEALEDDEVRMALKLLHAREKSGG